MKKGLTLFLFMFVLIFGVYIIFPEAVNVLTFSGIYFFSGEIWRIISFPLVHVSNTHLIENLLVLFGIILLSIRFKLEVKQFVIIFFLTNIIVGLGIGISSPYTIIAGASLGMFGIFGAVAMKEDNIVPLWISFIILVLILGINVSVNYANGESMAQPLYHAIGFFVGAVLFIILEALIKRKRFSVLKQVLS